jgi:hypothetical protein
LPNSCSYGDTKLDTDIVRVMEYPAGRSGPAISSGNFSGKLEVHLTLTIKSSDFDIVFASDLFVGGSGFVMSYQVSIFCFIAFNASRMRREHHTDVYDASPKL